MPALNDIQLEILKLFEFNSNQDDLKEIKDLLTDYLSKKAVQSADESYDKQNLSVEELMKWKNEHFRTKN